MTEKGTAQIIAMMNAYYPRYAVTDVATTTKAWHMILQEYDYETVQKALLSFVSNDTHGFPPGVGQIVNMIHETVVVDADSETPTEAWAHVMQAIRNSNYGSVAEFSKLSKLAQRSVGAPSQLRSWAMDEHFNEEVAMSHFIKTYKELEKREEKISRVPVSIRPERTLDCKQENVLCIDDVCANVNTEEFVPPPNDLHERLARELNYGL